MTSRAVRAERPDGIIERVKQRIDIVDLVSESVSLRKQGHDFVAPCPFHTEKTPSFHVNPERQLWRCYGACGEGGDVFSFMMKRDGVEFREALRLLAERAGVPLEAGGRAERDAHERLLGANEAAIVFFRQALLSSSAGAEARAYAERRGLDDKTIEAFELGFAPEGWDNLRGYLLERGFTEQELLEAGLITTGDRGSSYDRFRRRLIFPIRDDRGRAVGFGGRALDDAKPKYLNTPQTPLFDKGHLLYALDRAKEAVRRLGEVVVVEGYLDAITAHQFGYTNVVASLGTALTEHHIQVLRRLTKRVTFCMDADAAGLDAAVRGEEVARRAGADGENAVPVLGWDGLVRAQARAPVEVRVFTVPSGKDPDEAIREDASGWPGWVAAALPPFEFRLRLEVQRTDLNDPRARVELADRMLPLLLQIDDPALQGSYVDKLALAARTPAEALMARLRELTPKQELDRRVPLRQTVRAERKTTVEAAPLRRPEERVEAFALALVLRHPALREAGREMDPALFQRSDHRQLFAYWRELGELTAEMLPEELGPTLAALYAVRLPPLDANDALQALLDAVQKLRFQLLHEQKRLLAAELAELQAALAGDELQRLVQTAANMSEGPAEGGAEETPFLALLRLDRQITVEMAALQNEMRELRLNRPAGLGEPKLV